ncbi:hypothetical protein [Leucobacter sp. USHLN154]|uniref:hypothetical protein n=1 Tax=Leucobacter sp. USHLN154 TaxID=3081269 RepID=UPI00301705AE
MDGIIIGAMITGGVALIALVVQVISDRELSRRIERLAGARGNLDPASLTATKLDDVLAHLVTKLHARTVLIEGKRSWQDKVNIAARTVTAGAVTATAVVLLVRLEELLTQ